ncbi:MAG: FkbM family methyltransferase [Rhodothermales bacterium]|nr:FkbM family methyltransferase [Rhodothermales bacterium]
MNAPNPNDHIQNEWLGGYFYETLAGSRQGMLNYIYHNLRHLSDGLWVDAGANVGNHTVFFSAICDAHRVVAIEPVLDNLKVLRSNLQVNEIENVDVFDCAAGARSGRCSMAIVEGNNSGLHEVVDGDDTEVQSLDSIVANYPAPVRLIKIDVEDYNLPVLEGSIETLGRDHPVVFVECAETIELVQVNSFMVAQGYERVRGVVLNYTPTYVWEYKKTDD